MPDSEADAARGLFERAYRHHMAGRFERAADLYRLSIVVHATPEAHTFLGWAYSSLGRLPEAIDECVQAIAVDPSFGNAYNDIGAYLIALERPEQAIPWLERAIESERYESRHLPWYNLGRVYEVQSRPSLALACYRQSTTLDPLYGPALEAEARLTS